MRSAKKLAQASSAVTQRLCAQSADAIYLKKQRFANPNFTFYIQQN